jgi:formylglycine-generating enzyme required for sulfatase activity
MTPVHPTPSGTQMGTQIGGTQMGWGSGGYTPAPPQTYVPQQQSVSGTMLGAPSPEMYTPQPPLVSPAHGVPYPSGPHATFTPPGTPPGVPMQTPMNIPANPSNPGNSRAKKSSGAASFLIGLGSVLVLGGIAIVVVKAMSDDGTKKTDGTQPAASAKSAQPENKWVRIDPAKKSFVLGIESDTAAPTIRGFRPARKMPGPFAPFEIQQHEVTWAEIEPWLANQKGGKIPKEAPADASARAKLPATGISWNLASSYCKSIGGNLPTEEQWELAARGAERRKFAWGSEGIDLRGTRAFAGTKATLVPVMSNEQDKTPGDDPLYDMMGNAQEWTVDLYQDDFPDQDETWAQSGSTTFRAVRGFPVAESADPSLMATMSAAYREPVCATGSCAPGGSGGEPIVLVRSAFSTPVPEAGGPARPMLTKTILDAESDLAACLEKEDATRGLVVKVDYSLPLKKIPICRASDGYDDPAECCNGKTCPHAPHHWIKYDPAKATVTVPTEGWGSDAQAAGTCAKTALEKKLGTVKWPEAQDDWTATVWVLRVEAKPPKSLPWIGFRCVKAASKDKEK